MFSIRFEMIDKRHVLLPIDGTTFADDTLDGHPIVVADRHGSTWAIKGRLDEVIQTINAEMRKVQMEAVQQARLAGLGPINVKG